jgi:hypothetical protein
MLAFAVNMGAIEPVDNIVDWAKLHWVRKSKNPESKMKER